MELNELTAEVIDASVRIHCDLGPGLFESVYEELLAKALRRRGLLVEQKRLISFSYDGIDFEHGFKADLVVDGRVVVEVKSIERFAPVHPKQLLTYLRLMNIRVGLLLNFGAPRMKEGIKRVVNDLPLSISPRLGVNQRS
jgi:iron complex transport system substrate-binding protein